MLELLAIQSAEHVGSWRALQCVRRSRRTSQLFAQFEHAAPNPGLDGAQRLMQTLRDLALAQAGEKSQLNDLALIVGELIERRPDLFRTLATIQKFVG